MRTTADGTLTIRRSREDDALALRRLAQLDSAAVPAGEMMVADVDGQLRAAMAVETGRAIADPFRPTRRLVQMLEVARQDSRPVRSSQLMDGSRLVESAVARLHLRRRTRMA